MSDNECYAVRSQHRQSQWQQLLATRSACARKPPLATSSTAAVVEHRSRVNVTDSPVASALAGAAPAPTGGFARRSPTVPSKISCFLSPTSLTSTVIVSLPWNSPLSSSSESGSSTKFSIARRSGRAPKSRLRALLDQELLGLVGQHQLQAALGQPLADLAQLDVDHVASGRPRSGGGRRSCRPRG